MPRSLVTIGIIIGLVIVTGLILTQKPSSVSPSPVGSAISPTPVGIDPNTLPGIQTGIAPWPPELDHLKDRLLAIGLPVLSAEGTALHTHQHLDLIIHKDHIAIPADIGINKAAGYISPIHVHDDTNIIHVESPVIQNFTLGQFFDIWGVRLTANCVGGYCTDKNNSLLTFVDGKFSSQSPRDIVLQAHQEIVIFYGLAKELPTPIPVKFDFPPDY